MSLFKKIRQVFCHHYFVFDANKTMVEADGLTHRYIFTCAKCDMSLDFKSIVLSEGICNTFRDYADLKHNYLLLLAKYEPENYREAFKKYEKTEKS